MSAGRQCPPRSSSGSTRWDLRRRLRGGDLPGLDFVPTATIAWFLTSPTRAADRREGTLEAAPKKKADPRDGAIDVSCERRWPSASSV